MTNYNDGNWHGWNGGERPVHPDTIVDSVWMRKNGEVVRDRNCPARNRVFEGNKYGKIIAFRVIKGHWEPREWWIAPDGLSYADEELCPSPKIHVREVIEE